MVQPATERTPISAALPATDSWIPILIWIWLGGVVAFGARFIASAVTFWFRIRNEPALTDPRPLELFDECRRLMGTRVSPVLVETDEVDGPALFGLVRLRLLLPPGTTRHLTGHELRHVFLHELAHVRRHDVLLNWLATLLQILHWFNPILWFGFGRMRADRELACDAMALARGELIDRNAYGATLLKLVSGLAPARTARGLVGISENQSHLKQRIRLIVDHRKPARWSMLAGASILLALASVSLTDARATREPVEPESAQENAAPGQVGPHARASTTVEQAELVGTFEATSVQATVSAQLPSEELTDEALDDLLLLAEIGAPSSDVAGKKLQATAHIENGKLLYEMGRIAEAEAELRRALDLDPENRKAEYYLKLVAEAKDALARRRNPRDPPPSFHSGPGRQAIRSKLRTIVMDEVEFDGLPLPEVLKYLGDESLKRDPDRQGINFFISHPIVPRSTEPQIEPATGRLIEPFDMSNVVIWIVPPLRNVRLVDVLEAMVRVADKPIEYTIEDFGIGFSEKPPGDSVQLETRIFRVDTDEFIEGLRAASSRGLGASAQSTQDLLRDGLRDLGVNVLPPNQIYFGDRKGVLMIRATPQELDTIQQFIEALGGEVGLDGPTPLAEPHESSRLETRVFRVNAESLDHLGHYPAEDGLPDFPEIWMSDDKVVRIQPSTDLPSRDRQEALRQFLIAGGINVHPPNQIYFNHRTGVLIVRATPAELDVIQRAMEVLNESTPRIMLEARVVEIGQAASRELGFDWFIGTVPIQGSAGVFPGGARAQGEAPAQTPPAAVDPIAPTSAAGQITGILTERQFPVVLDALEQNLSAKITVVPALTTLSGRQTRITQAMADGVSIEIECLPVVHPDGYAVEIEVMVNQTGTTPSESNRPRSPATSPAPSDATRKAVLWDGQTLIVDGFISVEHSGAAPRSETARKNLIVTLTPTIVDRSGNPVHPKDTRPFDPGTIPPQPSR
jgi:beta-lactamase regulating signal transducer with metallopeptidase domain